MENKDSNFYPFFSYEKYSWKTKIPSFDIPVFMICNTFYVQKTSLLRSFSRDITKILKLLYPKKGRTREVEL